MAMNIKLPQQSFCKCTEIFLHLNYSWLFNNSLAFIPLYHIYVLYCMFLTLFSATIYSREQKENH